MEKPSGKIAIVATPLGNLGDITYRAQQSLASADAIYAEDTRVTGRLLSALGIEKPVIRLDEQIMSKRAGEAVERALSGDAICYCTDAGMPGVSDPGSRLISLARSRGVEVEVLPGPSAVVLAYAASATRSPRFYFGGFFPRKRADAESLLQKLRDLDSALIFYESPKRLVAALKAIAACFPHREVVVCRELTKMHEEIIRGGSAELSDMFAFRESEQAIKGEIVIVIDAPAEEEHAQDLRDAIKEASAMARTLRDAGMSAKDIARQLSASFDIPRNKAYEIAIDAH